jgi:tRNA A-37 threonylcarbamoyl transferase component Bud32
MTIFFSSFFSHSSELLTQSDFDAMCEGGTVLEQNEYGAKVVALKNGNIIKLFRIKHLVSGARLYSYARRFCRNAIRLQSRGIPTVNIKKLYHFGNGINSAVLYEPLKGKTLRQIAGATAVTEGLARTLAKFLSTLHQEGIHFHSLHTGNVVVTPKGEVGLIDISDLSIYPWSLFCNTRVRSFKRICRYPEDIKQFGQHHWQLFLQHYFEVSKLSTQCEKKIKQVVSKIDF